MRAAIILAAGMSRRFGRRDKLKALLNGRTLLDHAIGHARASGAGRILLVGSRRERRPGILALRTGGVRQGLSASLRTGLAALRPIEREVLIFLADMPFAYAPPMRLRAGIDALRPRYGRTPGHPMLIRTAAARRALPDGDKGLAGRLRTMCVRGERGHVIDIDTADALRRARRHGSRGRGGRSALA